jgi:small-conductance mechanosensitive channel
MTIGMHARKASRVIDARKGVVAVSAANGPRLLDRFAGSIAAAGGPATREFRHRGMIWLRRFVWLIVWALWPAIGLHAAEGPIAEATAATGDRARDPDAPAPVVVWNREITVIRAPFERFTPAHRAKMAAQRIEAIDPDAPEYQVKAEPATVGRYTGAFITVNDSQIFGVLREDADVAHGETFERYVARTVANVEEYLEARKAQQHVPNLLRGLLLAGIATLSFAVATFYLMRYAIRRVRQMEMDALDATKTLVIGGTNLRPYVKSFEAGLTRLAAWSVVLVVAYVWLTYVLNRFPYSRPWGGRLRDFLLSILREFATGILHAIPDLFTVLVIFLLTRLVVKVVTTFFHNAEAGTSVITWLEPDTARATRRIINVLIWIFGLVIAYPYLPGSQTDAFKGVSVFVGLMVSLGSAGLVSQVVGGLVVVYTRAFRVGEFIRIGEHEGTVEEVGMLATKITTITRQEITIPNAALVAATTVNYSRHAAEMGAIVSTTVTIGYDAPWRQVHAMLLLAAERTSGVRKQPPPWVMQRALSDFYVEYALLFTIDQPRDRNVILSELHAQIQDTFNEFGVQIMSPHFEAQPEGTIVVPKAKWHAAPAGSAGAATGSVSLDVKTAPGQELRP